MGLSSKMKYPRTERRDFSETIFGKLIEDPYRWLETVESSEVKEWINSQNEFAKSILDSFRGNDFVKHRLTQLMKYDAYDPNGLKIRIFDKSERFFFLLRPIGESQFTLYYQDGDGDKIELVSPIKMSPDGLLAIDWFFPSFDGSYVAVGLSRGGTENSELHVFEVKSGESVGVPIPHTRYSYVAWLSDNSGFYYSRTPLPGTVPKEEENYHKHVFFHKIGDDYTKDVKIFGEGRNPAEIPIFDMSEDGHYLCIIGFRFTETDVFVTKINQSNPTDVDFRPIVESKSSLHFPRIAGSQLYLFTQLDAPNGKIVRIELEDIFNDSKNTEWVEIVSESDAVLSLADNNFTIFDEYLAIIKEKNAQSFIVIYNRSTGEEVDTIRLETPSSVFSVMATVESKRMYFSIMNFFTPISIYKYDIAGETSTFLASGLNIDETEFKTELRWYDSKDGTKVSMFLLSKKDLDFTSETPVTMTGYGGFGISMTPTYTPTFTLWSELGGVVAIPHLGGGAEYGKEWHHAGNRDKKQNVFDDFNSAAEYLIENKIGSRATLTIYGGSNGGLLVGAALVQRPDLYSGINCAVPLLDMLRYTNFLIAKYWMPEYGDPEIEEEFDWLLKYSPYHHVKDGVEYPSTFFYTALGDGRVDPMHALKMTALVQKSTSGSIEEKPIFLWVETDAGHGVGMPQEKRIEVMKKQIVFLAHQSGIVFPE